MSSWEESFETIVRRAVREELQAASTADRLLTAEQVAEILAYPDVRSIYRLKKEKKLPFVALGENTYRFKQSDVQRFIENATSEI